MLFKKTPIGIKSSPDFNYFIANPLRLSLKFILDFFVYFFAYLVFLLVFLSLLKTYFSLKKLIKGFQAGARNLTDEIAEISCYEFS